MFKKNRVSEHYLRVTVVASYSYQSEMKVKYASGAKLPLEVDVVLMIVRDAPASPPGGESKLRTSVINDLIASIINLWSKAFVGEYVPSRKVLQEKSRKLLKYYYNEYYVLSVGSKKRKTSF